MALDGSDNLIDLNYSQQSDAEEDVEEFFIFEECDTHLQGDGGSLCTLMPTYAHL